mmetsp:Transcript_33847/g.46325  ORF Transcript_33847/g.46325 Transcript_33847/m.46325 type:complete len:350 (+) Transcript_33847:48-1097(+)|eukprot:CAMPEP_0201477414 /NCGR_PEP_ID=MMETSP0151_2-20130828/2433_1 /ASSEMBLY_ACC=CAM_ASM_000257 /TAXON_ID=200890 /ORGANISM="Paramoeba atlantica, Strain 621/1 / CCAP 1560/9" /LENGTH=349 /DNA_ID=CAMNT_0047858119 /DNA_START=49 /DNA_END=1098 /DNA_ORIENTATION=-
MARRQDSELVVFPFDGGQHRTGTQEGAEVLLSRLGKKKENVNFIDVEHGDGYAHKSTDTPIVRKGPVGSSPFMWNPEALKNNTRLIYDTARNYETPDCFGLFGDHSMEGGFFLGNSQRLSKHGFNHHLIMMDAHGDSHHPSSSPSGNCHGMMVGSIVMGVDLLYGSNPVHSHGSAGVDEYLLKQVTLGKPFSYDGEVWIPNTPPLKAKQLVMFGTHSVEPAEASILHEYKNQGAQIYTPSDILHLGVDRIVKTIRSNLIGDFPSMHISLDVDVTRDMKCTGTPEGLVEYDNVCRMLEGLVTTGLVRSGGMYEMNPRLRSSNLEKDSKIWADYYKILLDSRRGDGLGSSL